MANLVSQAPSMIAQGRSQLPMPNSSISARCSRTKRRRSDWQSKRRNRWRRMRNWGLLLSWEKSKGIDSSDGSLSVMRIWSKNSQTSNASLRCTSKCVSLKIATIRQVRPPSRKAQDVRNAQVHRSQLSKSHQLVSSTRLASVIALMYTRKFKKARLNCMRYMINRDETRRKTKRENRCLRKPGRSQPTKSGTSRKSPSTRMTCVSIFTMRSTQMQMQTDASWKNRCSRSRWSGEDWWACRTSGKGLGDGLSSSSWSSTLVWILCMTCQIWEKTTKWPGRETTSDRTLQPRSASTLSWRKAWSSA